MKKWFTNNKLIWVVCLLGMTLGCGMADKTGREANALPYYEEATFTPRWLKEGEVPADFHTIAAFELVNQEGEKITEALLNQKVTVVDFFFTTCPGICPKMTSNMLMVQEAFSSRDGVQILSHTVTPEFDDVDQLQHYANAKGVDTNMWHLLTGERDVIYNLGRNEYFIEEDLGLEKDPNDFIHTENFVLIDQNRRIRGIYNGLNKTSVNQLIADIKTLL